MVLQDDFLFEGTIKQNITIFKSKASKEKLMEAINLPMFMNLPTDLMMELKHLLEKEV